MDEKDSQRLSVTNPVIYLGLAIGLILGAGPWALIKLIRRKTTKKKG